MKPLTVYPVRGFSHPAPDASSDAERVAPQPLVVCHRHGRGTVVGMKFDWYLFIGSLFLLAFIVTRWVDSSFWNGLGVGLGLVSILAFGVGITTGLRKKGTKNA